MAKNQYAKRKDTVQAEIEQGLKQLGYVYWDCSRFGGGFPDLMVFCGGTNHLFEIKTGNAKLTSAEQKFFDHVGDNGRVHVARSLTDVLNVVRGG